MELRELAERVLRAERLEDKLEAPPPPDLWTDDRPGDAVRVEVPGRPPELTFPLSSRGGRKNRGVRMPHPSSLPDARCRAITHHILANHELQALEVMAWVLLAFPDADPEFRRGMATVLREEQLHTQWHLARIEAHGLRFGDCRVNGYVWKKTQHYTDVLDYLAGLPLTFENANLDHSLTFAELFRGVGDTASAAIMDRIHRDEIRHVAFGIDWLRRLKPPESSDWEAYVEHLHFPLRPAYAKGEPFDLASRRAAGLDEDFLARLAAAERPTLEELQAGAGSEGLRG